MPKVEVKKNQIWVGSKKHSLLSGEVHYWRLQPSNWKAVLTSVREMGLEQLSTYIPWQYHEVTRGKFDFTGKTAASRDLKGFLELVKEMGFELVIRPGPYIYSEWINDGVPDYAFKYHRLHPLFLEYAETYLKEVLKILKPYFASKRGGNILCIQADNEIDPWPDRFGHQYGLGDHPGLFQDFIEKLYAHDLEKLNSSWKTEFDSFDDVGSFTAPMISGGKGLALKGDRELRRNLDYLKFKHYYSAEIAKWNYETFKKLGVDIPIYLNTYPFFYAHDWADLQESSDFIGIDLYPHNELSEDEFEPRKFLDKVRHMTTVSKISFIAEFESGVWHQHMAATGMFTPNHYRLIALSALLAGCVGWNWYMIVNRDNWYMSPINEWGAKREDLFKVFKEMVSVYKQINPPTLKKEIDIAVTFNPLQYAARTMPYDSQSLVALYEGDIDYETYDPRDGICQKPFLFYSGNQWLSSHAHENLRNYVEGGGTLIAFQDYPRKDENFELSDEIGFENPSRILFEFKTPVTIKFESKSNPVELVSTVFSFDRLAGAQKIQVKAGKHEKLTLGYLKKVGKGQLVHLGIEPTKELVFELLKFLKASVDCYSLTPSVKTALFRRGSHFYLIAVNYGDEEAGALICLSALDKIKSSWRYQTLESKTQGVYRKGIPLGIKIPRKDGVVVKISQG